MSAIPLSILDLSVVPHGQTTSQALKATETLAKRADALGFHRFWVAEHHNAASVASTSPEVLIAHLAAATTRIRVGSGGVMLPNHSPLAVAERFAMLEALHPGRIDLGIGRAPGTDRRTAAVLRTGGTTGDVDEFPHHLLSVMGLLGDARGSSGLWTQFSATPHATSSPLVMLLGSSGYSAQLAGVFGLPFAYAHHFETGYTAAAVEQYLENFSPSPVLADPYVIVTVSALTAASDAEAEHLASPGLLRRYGLRSGRRHPLLPPQEAEAHPDFAAASAMPTNRIIGTPDRVAEGLRNLATDIGAHELMLFSPTHGIEERLAALDLIAVEWMGAQHSTVA